MKDYIILEKMNVIQRGSVFKDSLFSQKYNDCIVSMFRY